MKKTMVLDRWDKVQSLFDSAGGQANAVVTPTRGAGNVSIEVPRL